METGEKTARRAQKNERDRQNAVREDAEKRKNGRICRELFQCKRWVHNVGSEPVQRLYAERERRGFDAAVCITTSGYTKDGEKVARDLEVGTTDGTELMKKLDKYFPGQYYNGSRNA